MTQDDMDVRIRAAGLAADILRARSRDSTPIGSLDQHAGDVMALADWLIRGEDMLEGDKRLLDLDGEQVDVETVVGWPIGTVVVRTQRSQAYQKRFHTNAKVIGPGWYSLASNSVFLDKDVAQWDIKDVLLP